MSAPAHVHGGGAAPVQGKMTPAWRLLATLFVAGAAAGLLVVAVYRATLPTIKRYAAAKVDGAVREVLKAPAKWDTLYLVKDALVAKLPAGGDPGEFPKAYVAKDEFGKRMGMAVVGEGPGFQETMQLMIGFDPATGTLIGIKVLDEKETPGLGDKIEVDPSFMAQFATRIAPVIGVKGKPGAPPNQVQTITGATISSRAVIKVVNTTVARWQSLMQRYDKGETP
jgi:electron transport complex protein RnfG